MLQNPSPKQTKFFNESFARMNILEGSVRSGKSFISLLRFITELKDGPEGDYIIAGKSSHSVFRNIIGPLNALTKGIIRVNRGLGEFRLFGKKIYIVGANDERSEGKIRGATFAGALVDEISILPESFFRMLLSRLSIKDAKLFGTTNPDSPYHWLKTDFLDRAEELGIKSFKFNLEDNPSNTREFIDAIKKEYRGLWYRRFIDGDWVLAEGAIYDFFDESLYVRTDSTRYSKYYILGVDYGTSNPFAAILVGFNDDHHPNLWVEKEYYWDPKVMGYQKTDQEFAIDIIQSFHDNYPIRMTYIDPSAQSFELEMRRQRKQVKQANNDVIDGIRSVATLFTQGDIMISSCCTNLIKEIQGYVWDANSAKTGIDKPLKKRDHALDAMRYAIYSHWGLKHSLIEETREQRYQKEQEAMYAKNPMQYPGFTNSFGWQKY